MIDFLIHCLTASFICLGLNLAMDDGMILNFMREWYLHMLDNIEATQAKIEILNNQNHLILLILKPRTRVKQLLFFQKARIILQT